MTDSQNKTQAPKQLEQLAANDSFLEALTELLPVCLFAKDLEGRYIYVNEGFAAKTRIKDKSVIIGKKPSEVLAPAHAAVAEAEDHMVLETGEPIINRENRNRGLARKKNYEIISKICVRDKDGNKLGIAGITVDITERKLNENKLFELNQKLQAQNKRFEEELSLGREVQKVFVKVNKPGNGAGFDIGYHYQPSEKLSGDLIIAEPIDPDNWALLICDVMGHGIRSALVTGILRGFYDEHKAAVVDPASFVRRLNAHYNSLLKGLDVTLFTTLTCGIFNPSSGKLTMTTAGHHAPLWFGSDAGNAVAKNCGIAQGEPAVGLLSDFNYTATTLTFDKGDSLLFFTDGLVEACSAEGEEFGLDPIRAHMLDHAANDESQALVDAIVDQAHTFAKKIDDDVSLLLLQMGSG
ncbi:MAG: SpoIIE family protein phosphatase [Verrucomicrobia bacterium]|jgi:sigma-B regulation protein RsbU (phosphoserine phosphatase)|nr:SpoIIE family protein phosphatase [Verrucomicrobiota bacterium]